MSSSTSDKPKKGTTKLLAYRSKHFAHSAIGIVSADETRVTPLLFPNYRPVTSLHRLIAQWDEVGDRLLHGSPQEKLADVEVLPPLPGRDVLCVGKNYKAHATEFARSGYDSSDVKEQPDFPVIFTKRASSIVADGTPIYPHPDVTSSLDYEGELAIIIGTGGLGIKREDAWKHVWGACIVNDFTARERQRDHKQFYIGKSLDTFCPMGPYAVPSSELDWKNMLLETRVNGEVRQHQNTSELIFDIPTLIETCSMGITLQPGDVIATGTPAGVCLSSGVFLKSGDKIEVSITGLGTLRNEVGSADQAPACAPVLPYSPADISPDHDLVDLPSGPLHVVVTGESKGPTIVFIHGLGGWHTNFLPVLAASRIANTHRVVAFDLEGHGLSPGTGQPVSIDTFAESVKEVMDHVGAEKAVIVGNSMGGLIATTFAARYPKRVTKLFLIGPVRTLTKGHKANLLDRVQRVREGGIPTICGQVVTDSLSRKTQASRPLATGAVFASLLSQPAEGHALACEALAAARDPDYKRITAPVCILSGTEDVISSPESCAFIAKATRAQVIKMPDVGHWGVLEDVVKVAAALIAFID